MLVAAALLLLAQSSAAPRPQDTEQWAPEPPVVTPGAYQPVDEVVWG